MISALIGVLIIVVVGAICFWAIDKFATDGRLANLLKLLVVLICLGAILQRVLPLTGTYYSTVSARLVQLRLKTRPKS
jgi:apolipoprotein N-acyltransferase